MTTRTQGMAYEREMHLALEAEGWIVHRAYPSLRRAGKEKFFSADQDVFGIFDLIATKVSGQTLWIQVTSGETSGNISNHRRKMDAFLHRLSTVHPIRRSALLAIRYRGKKWRYQMFDNAGRWIDVDPPAENLKRKE